MSICEFTCLGIEKLKKHIENNHKSPDLPSLGDYLACLENKIDKCNELIIKQSVITSNQLAMIEKMLKLQEGRVRETTTTTVTPLKCNKCKFETVDRNKINSHINKNHEKQLNQIKCPMCSYSNISEHLVTKHVEEQHDKHPVDIQCPLCSYCNISEHNVTKHIEEQHDKQPVEIQCPLCSYCNVSQHNVTKHVESQHKEKYPCNKWGDLLKSIPCVSV